jgi:hypothetical protein
LNKRNKKNETNAIKKSTNKNEEISTSKIVLRQQMQGALALFLPK